MLTPRFSILKRSGSQAGMKLSDLTGDYHATNNPGGWWPPAPAGQSLPSNRLNPTRAESAVLLVVTNARTGDEIGQYELQRDPADSTPTYIVPFAPTDGVYIFTMLVKAKAGQARPLYSYSLTRPAQTGITLWVRSDGAWINTESLVVSTPSGRLWQLDATPQIITEWREINGAGQIVASAPILAEQTFADPTASMTGSVEAVVGRTSLTQLISRSLEFKLGHIAASLSYDSANLPQINQHRQTMTNRFTLADRGLLALEAAISHLSVFTAEKEMLRLHQLVDSINHISPAT
ncbi:hypothetical protein [Spirosoma sordidisoli]|uniref:Uncharacterized protein n=1 Tax=Spirosoma sordidisoli TaxID=2502893 RepID=A0A4Q2UPS0_9BACT|nr:hypothetical protein [Spirosoma sordidisoli]RYC69625.1 hypothetical protein EQG79_13560 [Spirosoma sordidisoli]